MKINSDNLEEILSDLGKVSRVLDSDEKAILAMRFGYHHSMKGRALTLKEVGEQYGVSRERIRQREAKALEKIKVVLKYEEKL